MENKSIAVMLSFVLAMSLACNSSKKNTALTKSSTMKANLIDGTWEPNYVMNSPKPFNDLYANTKPNITFNSLDGKVIGHSGCNQFNGTFTLDGSKINLGETMATTRKMCPDMTGETTFMETLKKVNSYSVTEQGKTLNLIMGDMAVMRLTRK